MPSTRALIHAPWSASKVATALRCPRLFHFKYITKVKEPEVMPETRIGKSIHKALELVLQGTPIAEATQTVRAELPNETEQARFDNLGTGIAPFAQRIQQFKRRKRVARGGGLCDQPRLRRRLFGDELRHLGQRRRGHRQRYAA